MSITPKGIERFKAAQEAHPAGLGELLFSHLSPAEIRQLAAITSKIIHACKPAEVAIVPGLSCFVSRNELVTVVVAEYDPAVSCFVRIGTLAWLGPAMISSEDGRKPSSSPTPNGECLDLGH